VFIQLSGLVVGSFQDGYTSHSSFGGSYESEILAGDAQKYFPTSLELTRGSNISAWGGY